MKLKLNNNYTITSDTNCYILNKNLLNKKTNGEYLQPICFYNTLDSLIVGLINRGVRSHDLESLNIIIAYIDTIRNEILTEVSKYESK